MVTIPNNWNEVTIKGYTDFMKSVNTDTDPTKPTVTIDGQIERVQFLTGCTEEEASKLKKADYSKVQKLIKVKLPQQLIFKYKLKGIKYRLIYQTHKLTGEKLKAIKTIDARQMNGGDYCAQMNCAKRGQLDSLHQTLFLLSEPLRFGFRKKFPFIGTYAYEFKDHEVEDRINDFKELKMKIANPAAVFFCKVYKELTTSLQDYSLTETQKMIQKMKVSQADLQADLDGLQ